MSSQTLPAWKILLVDPDPLSREISRRLCQVLGQVVEVASDGYSAAELAETTKYDLILCELELPVMSAFAMTSAIQMSSGPSSRSPIIAFTILDDRSRCIDAGMHGHVMKPVGLETLRQILSHFCGSDQWRGEFKTY